MILCVDQDESSVVLIPLDPSNEHVDDQVASYFARNRGKYVSGRRAINFSFYRLTNSKHERVDHIYLCHRS